MFQIFFTFLTIIVFFYITNHEESKKQEKRGISPSRSTVAKGIAIILIIIYHVGVEYNIYFVGPFGGIGVGIFAFLSGYGLESSYIANEGKKYWKKRFFSTILPYYFLEIFNYILHFKVISAEDIICDLLFLKPYYKYGWYMQFIVLVYIIFYFSIILNRYFKLKGCNNFIFLIILLPFFSIILNDKGCFVENRTIFFGIFLFGVLTKSFKWEKKYYTSVLRGIILIVLTFIIQILLLLYHVDFYYAKILIYLLYVFGIICFCVNVEFNKVIRCLINIGEYSYFLYLVHGITIDWKIVNIKYYGTILYVLLTLMITKFFFEFYYRARKVLEG